MSFDNGDLDFILDDDDDDFLDKLAYSAYAATCRCRNVDPTVSISGHAFKKMPSDFRSVWSRQSEENKAMLIKSIADRAHPDDIDTTIPANAQPWKHAAACPLQRKKAPYSANAASTVSCTTIVNFLEANKLHTDDDFWQYHAAATEAVNSTTANAQGGDSFFFEERSCDVNAASSKGTKTKFKEKPDAMSEHGSIQKLMR